MVSSAEMAANLFEAVAGQVPGQIHTDLPRKRDRLAAFFALQISESDAIIISDSLNNVGNADMLCGLRLSFEGIFGKFDCYGLASGRCEGVNGRQGAFELANVGMGLSGNVVSDLLGNLDAAKMGLFLNNSDFCIVAGLVNPGDKAPGETADKTVFKGRDFGRGAVGAQYDLSAALIKAVEGVE